MKSRISVVSGNLFDFVPSISEDINIIIHGCNAQGVMGSGFAKELRARFPEAYDDYVSAYNKFGLNLGDVIWHTGNENLKTPIIANAITQLYFGRDGKKYASYVAIFDCFQKINKLIHDFGEFEKVHLHFPAIASDLGGCDWEIVQEIILSTIPTGVNMTLYKL